MYRALVVVAVVAPALVACGGGGAATSTTPTGLPLKATTLKAAPPAGPADPEALVLNSDDLGDGWILVPSQTRAISLAEAVKGDPPALAKIDRTAYRSGYRALYANLQKVGVLAAIYRYADAAAARRIFLSSLRLIPRSNGVKPVRSPAGAPAGFRLFRGTTKQEGRSVPVYIGAWQRGTDIVGITLLGRGTTASQAVSLARKQDQRVAAPPPAA
jgi:hypothetical protein